MDEQWVAGLRAQFPVTDNTAYFDLAYENCGAVYMEEAVKRFFRDKAELFPGMPKLGGSGKGRTVDVITRTWEKLAHFLNAPSPSNLAFTANTCQAIGLVLSGLSYQPGDNIVVGGMEHVSVLMPCLHARRQGAECRVVDSDNGLWVTADELLDAVDEHTRIVAVSYVQSCSGYRIDLKRLVDGCHAKGVLVITDAIQALGLTDVDVQELGVDGLAGSGYKGMLALEGMGFLYANAALLRQLDPVFAGSNAAMSLDRENRAIRCTDPLDARKLEAGTVPFSSIYVLDAALDLIRSIGLGEIAAHVSTCYEEAWRGMEALGYRLATPLESEHRCNSFLACTDQGLAMTEFFQQHGVYISAGKPGYVRISVAPFTDRADLDRLLETAANWRCRP